MAYGSIGSRTRSLYRPSAVFVGLVLLWIGGGVLAWYDLTHPSVSVIVFVVAGWLVSLSLHEYAHALLAYHSGDRSVAHRGYLTLNPFKYTHPILSVVLPVVFLLIGGIGLPGGAVWVDRHAIRSRVEHSLVSAAGPGVNVVLAIALTVPFLVGVDVFGHLTFWAAWAFLAFLQVTAALLNLLPIPGVDGGNMLRPWLSPEWGRRFDMVAPFGMLLLIAILFEPRANAIFFDVVFLISDVIGLPPGLWGVGRSIFQFWR